jgi:hypothetical protein
VVAAILVLEKEKRPFSEYAGFFPLTLLVDLVIAAIGYWGLRLLKRRLSADPSVVRILSQNASQFHRVRPQRTVMASTNEQRATRYQNLAAARQARSRKLYWALIAPAILIVIIIFFFKAFPGSVSGVRVATIAVICIALFVFERKIEKLADRRRRALTQVIKQQALPSAAYALKKDQRLPILLLRSFADDATMNGANRFEETIAPILELYGPVIAVGDPQDTLPRVGAYRDYVNDNDWREHVRAYIRTADVIVLIPGQSHWVQWELEQILEGDFLNKVILVFPPGQSLEEKTKRLEATWRAFQQRTDLVPLQTWSLQEAVSMHFFNPETIMSVTHQPFKLCPPTYDYAMALMASLSGQSASFYFARALARASSFSYHRDGL